MSAAHSFMYDAGGSQTRPYIFRLHQPPDSSYRRRSMVNYSSMDGSSMTKTRDGLLWIPAFAGMAGEMREWHRGRWCGMTGVPGTVSRHRVVVGRTGEKERRRFYKADALHSGVS